MVQFSTFPALTSAVFRESKRSGVGNISYLDLFGEEIDHNNGEGGEEGSEEYTHIPVGGGRYESKTRF